MDVSLIVAMSENRVIGLDNKMPWHLPNDLKHFKEITWGKPILMGRKTYESIGLALPGRINIVLTSDPAYVAPDCVVVNSIEEVYKLTRGFEELMVIGGSQVFETFLPYAKKFYLTDVHAKLEGDTFFPEFNRTEWEVTEEVNNSKDEKHAFNYTFLTLKRENAEEFEF